MKKTMLWFCCLSIFLISSVNSFCQYPEEELEGLLDRIEVLVGTLHKQGYTIVHIEVDKLEKGQYYTANRKLYDINDYAIMGIGGVGIADLDLELIDEGNNLIDKDDSDDNIPVLQVTPKWDGKFYIKTSVHSLEEGYKTSDEFFFCWIIGFKRSDE